MKFFYHFLIALFLPFCHYSQEYRLDWGEIPRGDRLMTDFPADTLADALVLGETGKLYFRNIDGGYDYLLQVHRRIKLLDKKAFDSEGRVSIPLYHHDNTEQLLDIDAQTITPDGQVLPLSRKDFYYERKDDYWTHVNFTFPKLEEGSVVEYRYTLQSKNIVQARSWYFQKKLPVRFSQLQVYNVSHLSFVTLFEGAEYMEVVSKEGNQVRLRKGDMRFLFSDEHYVMENAPAIREEPFMTNIDDYCVRLRFQLSEVRRFDGTRSPFLSTWEQSAGELIKNPFFGGRYLQKKSGRRLLRALKDHTILPEAPEAKMRTLYRFLVEQVQWDGAYGIQPRRELFEAFKSGKAGAAELNFMLLALLHALDIEAYPVLTSTRAHGRMTQQYPLMDQFNYVLVLVSIDGRSWLLDATHPLRPPGMPGLHALNKKAWIVNPEWPQWINLEAPVCTDSYLTELSLTPDGRLTGRLQATYSSYSALEERRRQRDDPRGQYWQGRLQKFHPDAALDSVTFRKIDELEEDFIARVFFNIPEYGAASGDFLYLQPVIYSNFSENPFKQETRNFPVDFLYPFEEEWQIVFHLPPNSKIIELPEAVQRSLPNGQGAFSFDCRVDADRIMLNSRLIIQQDLIAPADYPALRELFDHYVQQLYDRIVIELL